MRILPYRGLIPVYRALVAPVPLISQGTTAWRVNFRIGKYLQPERSAAKAEPSGSSISISGRMFFVWRMLIRTLMEHHSQYQSHKHNGHKRPYMA